MSKNEVWKCKLFMRALLIIYNILCAVSWVSLFKCLTKSIKDWHGILAYCMEENFGGRKHWQIQLDNFGEWPTKNTDI